MKKRNIIYVAVLLTGFQLISACDEREFLEIPPKGRSLEENYYRNQEEAFNGLVAAYDPVGWVDGLVTKVGAANSASDDHFAGGGHATDMNEFQVWDQFTLDPAVGPQENLWRKGYQGIFRANVLLSKLPAVEMDEALKARYAAEAKFLRAFYYFDLIRLFERIPLITEPLATEEVNSVEQVDRELVFAQIEKDLLEAIPDLPATLSVATDAGRATEGAARALWGKVFLQQEKCKEAAEQLSQVNGEPGGTSQFGYKLLDNFEDLWRSDNKFNSESIFEVSHTNTSNGGWGCIGCTEGNVLSVMVGPRGYGITEAGEGIAPALVSGWSFNPITQSLVNAFINSDGSYDPRYKATVINVDSLSELELVTYTPGYDNTGYFVKKFAGKSADQSTGGGNWELNFPQNSYEIRLADTYLMEAEALVRCGTNPTRALALLNAVRARAGAKPLTEATLDNIMHERRLELAAEGHRWFDLVRTGRAAAALKDRGYVEGKHDKLPIPLLELDNTMLQQDPAYQ